MKRKRRSNMINGKVLYTPKGAALEYGRVGANFYTGCPHNCEYCYLKRGVAGKTLGGTEVKLKKSLKDESTAYAIYELEVAKHLEECREHGIFFSFTTDPLILETRYLTLRAVFHCVENGIPVWLLTKDASFVCDEDYMDALFEFSEQERSLVYFGWALTGRDDMELNASSNIRRIMAMGMLRGLGFKTWASIEPVVDWGSAKNVVQNSLPYCDHYKIGLRSGVKKDYYDQDSFMDGLSPIVDAIVSAGKTVYLKKSVRRYLTETLGFSPLQYNTFLEKTVDATGNPFFQKEEKEDDA